MPRRVYWDELRVSKGLLDYRAQQKDNRGASFETIGRKHFELNLINEYKVRSQSHHPDNRVKR